MKQTIYLKLDDPNGVMPKTNLVNWVGALLAVAEVKVTAAPTVVANFTRSEHGAETLEVFADRTSIASFRNEQEAGVDAFVAGELLLRLQTAGIIALEMNGAFKREHGITS